MDGVSDDTIWSPWMLKPHNSKKLSRNGSSATPESSMPEESESSPNSRREIILEERSGTDQAFSALSFDSENRSLSPAARWRVSRAPVRAGPTRRPGPS